VNEPSEYVLAPDTVDSDDGRGSRGRSVGWRSLADCTMGAMLVVVADIDRKNSF
jgi:hypothetical protein